MHVWAKTQGLGRAGAPIGLRHSGQMPFSFAIKRELASRRWIGHARPTLRATSGNVPGQIVAARLAASFRDAVVLVQPPDDATDMISDIRIAEPKVSVVSSRPRQTAHAM